MTVTLGSSMPSLAVTDILMPVISNFKAEFVYNHYTSEELLNAPSKIQSGVFDPNTPSFSRNVPRYIHLTWNKIVAQSKDTIKQEFVDLSIQENSTKITNQVFIGTKYFGTFSQQEIQFAGSVQNYLNNLWQRMGYNRQNVSIPDVVRAIHEITPNEIDQDFLNKYLNYSTSQNITTTTPSESIEDEDGPENVVTNLNVANRSFGSLFYDKVLNDSLMPIDQSSVNNVVELYNRQKSKEQANNKINASQYEVTVQNPVSIISTEKVPDFSLVYQNTGYVIERTELVNNTPTNIVKYYIEDPSVVEFFDTQVVYNKTYDYKIYPVIAAQTLGYDTTKGSASITTFLVGGEKTSQQIRALDETPPPPPTDFFVRWDYKLKKPVLTWNFPVDTRRHIKYFQVFRRRDVGQIRPAQLPFELVRMYDFNDLQNANGVFYNNLNQRFSFLQRGESNIDASVVLKPRQQQQLNLLSETSYVDEEFDNEGYFIYAVACVDAHGISSNYSNQLGVRWNKQRNTIDIIDVSVAGAPKPYPNLYLNKDTFVDTIKNEGFSQMTVVFNPEYLNVVDSKNLDLQFLATRSDSKYRIQLINTDLQLDQFFDITIKDDRSNR